MFHALRTAGRILVGWNIVWWPEDPNYQCAPGFSGGYPPINQPFDIETPAHESFLVVKPSQT